MRKIRFATALAIYAAAALLVILAGLWLFWQYIAAYELSLPDGAIDQFMADGLSDAISREIDRFAASRETVFEPAGSIAGVLRSAVEGGALTCPKAARESTPEEPVYSIRLDGQEIGRVYLASHPGGLLDFGFRRWSVLRTELSLEGFAQDYTVLAPSGAPIALGGQPLTPASCPVSWEEPAELLPYSAQLAQMPLRALYSFSAFAPVELTLTGDTEGYLLSQDGNAFTVTQLCPPELSGQLRQYAEDFVGDYIAFASNSADAAAVTGYLVPGSTLYQRVFAALDGLSWIEGVTGRLSELTIDDLEYYGCAATLEAHYRLSHGRMDTDNNMKIVLTQTEAGWRVAEIELF